MKKIFSALIIIFALVCFYSCTTYNRSADVGKLSFAYSDFKNDCYIGCILYQVGDDTDIIIPDESDGYPVTALGGYFGTGVPDPFRISFLGYDNFEDDVKALTSGKFGISEEFLYNGYFDGLDVTVEDIKFCITLPSGLKEINDVLCDIYYDKELDEKGNIKIKVMRPVYYFEITDENEYFYTENGKLYNKKTGELVSDFVNDNYVTLVEKTK